jgi:hypothetical protein
MERGDTLVEVSCREHHDGEELDDFTVEEDMSVTLTRKELYDRVWEEPVDTLAKEYGLSNVGLGKACRRHDIPVPPRGYWARKAAGQEPRRPPLPPAKDGDESVTLLGSERPDAPSDERERAVHPLIAFELEAQNKIAVPEDLRVKHPAIAQTKAYWAAQKRGEVPHGDNKLPRLNISVSKTSLPRAFLLLQALFNALEQRGHTAKATKEGKTILTVLDEALEVSLREPSKQVRHVPTAKELADAKRYSWMRPAPYDLVSSGTLVLNIENVWGTRHAWKDGKTQRLEDVLNEVVVGLIEAALQKKAQRVEQERTRLKQEELERRREEARQRERQERARVRRLERLLEASNDHRRLREFVAQLHEFVGAVDQDTEMGRWLSWADDHVQRLDPLTPFREPSATIRLYYLTTRYAVPKILEAGFTDRDPEHGEDKELPASVPLTDAPMTRNGYDEARLAVDIPEAVVLPYEWITASRNHRRFSVPAVVVNKHGRVSEEDEN